MTNKPRVPRKKPDGVPTQGKKTGKPPPEAAKPPPDRLDTDGLTGEGADSALAHLREIERGRQERDEGLGD